MHETTAEDLMIPLDKYPRIRFYKTIKDAISLFFHSELKIDGKTSLTRAILVFDNYNKMVGMVRRRDIMRGFQSKDFFGHKAHHPKMIFEIKDDPELLEIGFERLQHIIKEKGDQPVSEVMVGVTHTVNHDDHMIKIIYKMCDQQYSLLPVLWEGEVIGVIRTVEVMNEIGKILSVE